MGFTSYGNFNGSFRGPETGDVTCGRPLNVYQLGMKIVQAKLPTTLTNKDVLAAYPVAVDNRVGAANTGPITGMNPNVLEVTALGTTATAVGFALVGPVDSIDSDGGVGYAHTGGLVNVGLLGSGLEVYLPASANLANVAAGWRGKLIWDATNLCLDVYTTGDDSLTLTIKSALVDGYKLKKNASSGLVEYVATKAIKVQL